MSVRHVVPANDLVEHHIPDSEDADGHDSCACGPRVEHVANEVDGPDGWVYVHHSLDGREAATERLDQSTGIAPRWRQKPPPWPPKAAD